MLAGSTVTNTGPTVINGDLGVSPGNAIVGFPPGIVNGVQHAADANALQAQNDLTTAYNNLMSRPTTVDLTGRDLGGLTLIPGVYFFASSAQLTGGVTLNALGNVNAVFIFNIGTTLTTASASTVTLVNGAQGGNVFWRVGSSATLGTSTTFNGDILAQASITLTTTANIICGAAWARTGAVTLDTNTISLCALLVGPDGGVILGPNGVPLAASLLPASANNSQRAVANAIDSVTIAGGTLPFDFANLFNLSPSQLADAFSQLQGEAGTGAAQAATQAMNSLLSLVTNPFDNNNRPFAERPGGPMVVKALGIAPENAEPAGRSAFAFLARAPHAAPPARRWGIWAAAYGGQSNASGDPVVTGSHDRSVNVAGYATGLDYRVTPNTVVGFALAGGGTNYGVSGGFGGGRSDMFQAALYSSTRIDAAYLSTALAYGWHRFTTDRYVTVAGNDHLVGDFTANNIGGRVEGGYRFAIPNVPGLPGWYGITPYAAGQIQAVYTSGYSERAVSGSPVFALTYDPRTTTTLRTELGAWFDWSVPIDNGSILTLRSRAAWAHDYWSDPSVIARFQSLPNSVSITEFGAEPARDSLLTSAGAEIAFNNGFSLAARFDGEFAAYTQKYAGTGRLRYMGTSNNDVFGACLTAVAD